MSTPTWTDAAGVEHPLEGWTLEMCNVLEAAISSEKMELVDAKAAVGGLAKTVTELRNISQLWRSKIKRDCETIQDYKAQLAALQAQRDRLVAHLKYVADSDNWDGNDWLGTCKRMIQTTRALLREMEGQGG